MNRGQLTSNRRLFYLTADNYSRLFIRGGVLANENLRLKKPEIFSGRGIFDSESFTASEIKYFRTAHRGRSIFFKGCLGDLIISGQFFTIKKPKKSHQKPPPACLWHKCKCHVFHKYLCVKTNKYLLF